MINPAEIVDALVDLLRDIPELVDEVGGDEEKIFAYHDGRSRYATFDDARNLLVAPGVMVAIRRTADTGGMDAWRHEISISLRAKEEDVNESPTGYYRLFRLIVKGVPATLGDAGIPMNNRTVHASCYPMESPTWERQTDQAGIDFFEVVLTFREIGDD